MATLASLFVFKSKAWWQSLLGIWGGRKMVSSSPAAKTELPLRRWAHVDALAFSHKQQQRVKEKRAPIDPIGCSSLSVFCSTGLSPLLTFPPSLPLSLPPSKSSFQVVFSAFALPEIIASVRQFCRQNQAIIDCFPSSVFGKAPLVVQNDLVCELGAFGFKDLGSPKNIRAWRLSGEWSPF